MTDLLIRWLIRRDLEFVLDIERRSFAYFWTEDDFLSCLRQRNCIGMVAERDEKIVGFMLYELQKTALHVLNFAVCPTARHTGVGTAMVAKLVNKLAQQKRTQIVVEVREGNLDAQLFFRSQGFAATGVMRGYYDYTDEDAYQFRYRIGAKVAARVNRIAGYL